MTNERTPLLPTHAQPSQGQIDQAKSAAFSLAKAAGALKAGKLPSQQQLDRLIDAALSSDVLSPGIGKGRTGRLSEDGTRVLNALRSVLEAVKALGDEKNGDNKVQDGIHAATQVEAPSPITTRSAHFSDLSSTSTLPSRKELNRDSDKLLKSLSKIGTLLVTSPQFRLVINQAISLSASIVADASGKIAEKAGEVEKQARQTGDDDKPIDLEEQKRKGKQVAKGLQSGRIQGEAREAVMNSFEGLERYFEDKISGEDEARDKLFEKLQSVVKDVQSNPDYQNSIDTILSLLKKYYSVAEKVADDAAEKAKDEADQGPLHEALGNAKELVEAFASGESLDPVLDAAKDLKEDISNDHRIEQFFSDVGNFLEACLKVPGYVTSQRASRRSSALWDRSQKLLAENDKYKKDADKLVNQLQSFATALSDDEATANLGYRLEELGIELSHAAKTGVNALKAESAGLYRDFIDVILPRAIALIKEIPAPRTEFKSEHVDFVVDDVKFVSASFIPDRIRVINHNDLVMTNGYAAFAADYDSNITLRVEGFKFEAHDIAYWIHKKTGFLTFEDEGLLSIEFDGRGISFDVTLENASEEDRESFFVVKKVNVDVSNLEYSISRNSSWLLWFAKPFVSGLLKQNLKSTLEHQIKDYLQGLDLELFGLQQRAIAATNAKPSPLNYVKAVFSPSVFGASGSSTTKVTQKGVVKHGRRGEYLLAIGVDDQLFPGKASFTDAHAKRSKANDVVEQGKALAGKATKSGDAERTKGQVKQVGIDAQAEANKLGLTIDGQARKERRKDGWKSEAFDI